MIKLFGRRMTKQLRRKAALAIGVVCGSLFAEARQMLYCYDFDMADTTGTYIGASNKGTGTLAPTPKSNRLAYVANGAFGSDHALLSSSADSAIWIGNGTASVGCSGLSGFTMSFWVKAPAKTPEWSDFFGFRFADSDVRFEYGGDGTSGFRVYSNSGNIADPSVVDGLQAGEWTHCCLVWNFNTCAIDLYLGGTLRATLKEEAWDCGGVLQQIHIGGWVRSNGADRTTNSSSNTGIDDFALFDFSATSEQVQWLAHNPPALPPKGPGRDMPYRFSFDRASDSVGGVRLESYGSAQGTVSQYGTGYRQYITGNDGAFGTPRAYNLKEPNSITVSNSGERGLGATVGTGFTFSIWVKGVVPAVAYSDFFGFSVGNRGFFAGWRTNTSPNFTLFGAVNGGNVTLKSGEWNNVCCVWNADENRIDTYLNGVFAFPTTYEATALPAATEAVTKLEIGAWVLNGGGWYHMGCCNVPVDEAALFNYSFTKDEIAELLKAPPMLPPFTAANLVRTVDASGMWQDFAAHWTVSESAQRLMWPAWEDVNVDAAVTVAAANLTLENDTFVTCRSLTFANGTGAASVRMAIPNAAGAIFRPQKLGLGDGVELLLSVGDSCTGAVTLGENAKLVFDASAYEGVTTAFSAAGGFVLPEGETDVLAHTLLLNGGTDLELCLSADGKQIVIQPKANVPAIAVWTGNAGDRNLATPGNWDCWNVAGAKIQEDVVPTARTVIQIHGQTNLSVPTTAELSYARVELTGDVTLTDDCDWKGFGRLVIPNGVSVDVNGHTLSVDGLAADKTGSALSLVTSGVAGGVLDYFVESGRTDTIDRLRLAGQLELVKRGEGTLVLAVKGQTYTGGTTIHEGTLMPFNNADDASYSQGNHPVFGPAGSAITVEEGGTFDSCGVYDLDKYKLYLNGGTYTSSRAVVHPEWGPNSKIEFGADSFIAVKQNAHMAGPFSLNDHTLTATVSAGKIWYMRNGSASNGTIKFEGEGKVQPYNVAVLNESATATDNVTFDIACAFDMAQPITVQNYIARYSGNGNTGSSLFLVTGRFVPIAQGFIPCTLAADAVLDLSEQRGTWNLAGNTGVVRFSSGKVTVDLGDRCFTSADKDDKGRIKLVSWTPETKPSDDVRFRARFSGSMTSEGYSLLKEDDGLYAVKIGCVIHIN